MLKSGSKNRGREEEEEEEEVEDNDEDEDENLTNKLSAASTKARTILSGSGGPVVRFEGSSGKK